MNRILILVPLILLFANSLIGQYIPLVEEGKFWIYRNYSNPDSPSTASGHAITFLGDTTINSIDYKKVYQLNLKGQNPCWTWQTPCWSFDSPYETESKYLKAFIREDSINKKIYLLPNSSSQFCELDEHLLFDFSLVLGDTLNNCVYESIWAESIFPHGGGIVDSIKIVETHGKSRNTIFTFGFYVIVGLPHEIQIQISEGLGYREFGIFYKPQSAFVDYCEGEIENCSLILSNETIDKEKEIKVFPNPSSGIFQVLIEQEKLKCIRAYSIFGQLKKESKFTNKIDLGKLENGIYILKITTKENERIIKKIKKEN